MKKDTNAKKTNRLRLTKESVRDIVVKTKLRAGEPTTGPGAPTYTCGGCAAACA